MPGYAELARTKGHRRHFPNTTFDDFSVLLVTVSAKHRDRLRSEIAKQTDHRPDLWLFAAIEDFTPENVLYAPIMYDHSGEAGPLLDAPQPASSQRSGAIVTPSSNHPEVRYAD